MMSAPGATANGGPSAIHAVLARERILPVVVIEDAASALPLGESLQAGGLSSIEITLRTAAAETAIATVARGTSLLVGAGTVLTRDQAARAIAAGAQFVVSPGVSSAVIGYCHDAGVPVFPGVATPTDILTALELGCPVVKFFPADVNGGLPAIKALSAPFGRVQFVPTGGITEETLAGYLAHPAVLAVGGSWIVARPLIAAQDWSAITKLVSAAVAIAGEAPGVGGHDD
jgi:2-dehydro-3-deoxyphosphogluconate aldolase/(4S)-4-hydroxy-2-oxoglutarate aldolase